MGIEEGGMWPGGIRDHALQKTCARMQRIPKSSFDVGLWRL